MNLYADISTSQLKGLIEIAQATIAGIDEELANTHWRDMHHHRRVRREETKQMMQDRLNDMQAELTRRQQKPSEE